jgi:hypothetical protein
MPQVASDCLTYLYRWTYTKHILYAMQLVDSMSKIAFHVEEWRVNFSSVVYRTQFSIPEG